ncbi:MAG: hypothetical protein B6D41_16645 [Chloroflexi bacterium UTCFX4]|jgi:hypothetical protein|nr:MAG: hypothetical protein B6D41_16645 [Chloroflexi bacterium UTCFX4]
MAGLKYRARQFWLAVRTAPLAASENARVRACLGERAFALYQTMPRGDQRHALAIFDGLVAQGHCAPPLLQAALLHDVAKRELGLGYRAAVVLLTKFSADGLARAARAQPNDWRYPFYISLHHPRLGAQLAAQADIVEPTLTLIRAHQDALPHFADAQLVEWHRALKVLDDLN